MELTRPDNPAAGRRRRSPGLEISLLVVGLVALAFGAGAVGWTIGQAGSSTRTVTVAAGGGTTGAGSTTSTPSPAGDPAAGKAVFVNSGCGSCHTLAATRATGTVGPNLDQVKLTPSEILGWVGKGKGAMPSFKGPLSDKQLADVVAFLAKAESR